MADAESPASLFELLYCFFPAAAKRIAYDNACNTLNYALNRDPIWAASQRFFVDAMHYKGHKACAGAFNIGTVISIADYPTSIVTDQCQMFK
jgi:hypothetical protein